MTQPMRRFRVLERKFLMFYSAWQETHRLEFAEESNRLLSELLHLNPRYSFRSTFALAF